MEKRGRESEKAAHFNSSAWAKFRSPQQGACICYSQAKKIKSEKCEEWKVVRKEMRREKIKNVVK